MEQLKPCPFCGGEAELIAVPHIPNGTDYVPRCKVTSCCGRLSKKYPSKESALEHWNIRTDGWISVREMPPEDESHVIVYSPAFGAVDAVYYVDDKNKNVWAIRNRRMNVTHWMPLPEAPKGE